MAKEASKNVVAFLRDAAVRVPERSALILDGTRPQSITFGDLWNRIDRISVGLRENGLHPGDRAICMIPMSIDLYVTLLGTLKMGASAVFVDPWMGLRQIAAFSAYATPRAYLGIPKSHVIRFLDSGLRKIPLTVTTGGSFLGLPGRVSLQDLLACNGDGVLHPSRDDESALITFTSGSSGTPKGANRTHGFLSAQHQALMAEFMYEEDDVDMPMFPVFALNNMAQGVTSVVPDMDFKCVAEVDAETILAQMHQHRVTTCTASPPFFDRLTEHLAKKGRSAPALRRILTGGAPVTDAQLRRWQIVLPETEIVVVYGSTEAEPVAHVEASERLAIHDAMGEKARGFCVGRPSRHIECRVIRITENAVDAASDGWDAWTVEPGEIGELVVTGDHVCKDYYNNAEAVAQNKIVDGKNVWHRMGDTGYFDEEGRFWIVGRTHSTILRDGQFVHPQMVERIAAAEIRDVQVAAVGCPDERLGQKVVLVASAPNETVDRAALEERLAQAGIVVDAIVVTDQPLPVDPRHNSKIDYQALRQELQTGGIPNERP